MPELTDAEVFGTAKEMSDAEVFGTQKELSDADVFRTSAPSAQVGGFQGVSYNPGRETGGPYDTHGLDINPLTGEQIPAKPPGSLNPLEPILAGVLPRYEPLPPLLFGQPSKAEQIAGGTYNALAGATESLTSPAVLLSGGLAEAAPVLQRPIAATWAAIMAKDIPKQVEQVNRVFQEDRPLNEKVEAAEGLAMSLGLTGLAAKHALTPAPTMGQVAGEMLGKAVEEANIPSGARTVDIFPRAAEDIPLVENLRTAKAPLTAAVVEQAAKAPETPAIISEPRPTPENAPTAPPQPVASVPETAPEANTPEQMAARAEEALAAREAPKPAAPAEVAKEPWQMTREEFAKENEPDYPATYKIELEAVAGGEKPAHYGFYPAGQPWAAEVYNRAKQLGLHIKKGPRKNDYIITRDTESGRSRADTIFTVAKDAVRDPNLLDDVKWHDSFAKLLGYGPEFEGRIQAISGPTALENKRLHRHFVWLALREGKPVPPEVLAEYPDLKPTPAAEAVKGAEWTPAITWPKEARLKGSNTFYPARTDAKGLFVVLKNGKEIVPSHKSVAEVRDAKAAQAVPEPAAISFPGVGSLREADANPMRLGKIKANEPELWKAITQMFGTTIPARVATLAKQRFEQMKAAPTPTEPPLGGAMTMGVDPVATTKAVVRLFNQARENETVDRITRQVAGHSAPITMAASESSGEALIRFASARGTGRLMGRAKATEVLGEHAKDETFRKKLGAVIVQDQLDATKAKFQELADKETDPEQKAEYQDMANKAGAAGSPFKSKEAFRAALEDPEIQAALERHREIVQPIAEEAHKMLGGRMMTAGESTGTFANLIAIMGEEKAGQVFGGGRGELTRPRKRPSKFFFERRGTAAEYETDYQKIASRMVEGNWDEVAKRELYDQLEADDLAVVARPGIPRPEIGGKKTVKFEIQRRGIPGGRTQTENLWVREDVARELRQALDVDGPVARAGLVRAAAIANTVQLAGPTDAVFHMANMLSRISAAQGGRNVLVDLARKVPGVNVADTLTRLGASVMRVVRDSPEIQNRIAELSDIGAMRPLMEIPKPEGLQKLNPFAQKYGGRLIQLLDVAGRLVREDLFNNLVKRGLVEDTPANRREWVNQLGQYNPRLMGQFQRVMRDFGLAPFVVAGRNFNRNAIRSLMLSQGVKAASPRAWATMKAVDVAGFAMAVFAIPMLLNYWLIGDPKGRPGTKIGQIDPGKGDIRIDPLQWTGIRRGARITGLDALTTDSRWNASSADTKYHVGRDIVNGILHPWMGPVPKAGAILTTGYGGVGFRESENPKDWAENLKAASEQVNPVVKSVVKGWEQKAETSEAGPAGKAVSALASTAKSLASAVGVKERRETTARRQITGVHDDWLASHPDPKVRADYERHLADQLAPAAFMPVYSALQARDGEALMKAVDDITAKGTKLSQIKKQLDPIVESGKNRNLEKNLFHQSRELEKEFRDDLTPKQRELYDDAREERKSQWRFFKEYY